MNFLSHYYFDRNTKFSNLVVGIVLPDLIKNAKKDWNLHPEKLATKFDSPQNLNSIFTGWKRHILIDRYFHNSLFFTEHTKSIKLEIAPILQNSPIRPSFLAHIALEVMLDSLLIIDGLIDVDDFYSHLLKSDRHSISHFLELNQLKDTSIFFNFFDKFIESRYLHSYRETHKITYALNRICMRIWADPLNESQKLQLTTVLVSYLNQLRPSFMEIFVDIDSRLN